VVPKTVVLNLGSTEPFQRFDEGRLKHDYIGVVISQQDNHDHLCSNPILLSAILGKNGVPQELGKLYTRVRRVCKGQEPLA